MVKIGFNKLKLDKLPWAKIDINKIPLNMIPLNKIPLNKLNSLLKKIAFGKDIKENEKIINYIRIYTSLVSAYSLLNKHYYERAFDHLVIVKNVTREVSYRGEKQYLDNINNIVKDLLKKRKTIVRRLNKYEGQDPAHAKTNLLLAQNICVLRIIKISS